MSAKTWPYVLGLSPKTARMAKCLWSPWPSRRVLVCNGAKLTLAAIKIRRGANWSSLTGKQGLLMLIENAPPGQKRAIAKMVSWPRHILLTAASSFKPQQPTTRTAEVTSVQAVYMRASSSLPQNNWTRPTCSLHLKAGDQFI